MAALLQPIAQAGESLLIEAGLRVVLDTGRRWFWLILGFARERGIGQVNGGEIQLGPSRGSGLEVHILIDDRGESADLVCRSRCETTEPSLGVCQGGVKNGETTFNATRLVNRAAVSLVCSFDRRLHDGVGFVDSRRLDAFGFPCRRIPGGLQFSLQLGT